MLAYVRDYGAGPVRVSERTWETSVCTEREDFYELLLDLCDMADSKTDMVLLVRVHEPEGAPEGAYAFELLNPYVPQPARCRVMRDRS